MALFRSRVEARYSPLDNNDLAAVEQAFDADPHDPRLSIAGLYAAAGLQARPRDGAQGLGA